MLRLDWSLIRDIRTWFLLVFVGVVVANASLFERIDNDTASTRQLAFATASTADFLDMVLHNGSTRARFDLYYVLGEIAPGSHVVIDSSTGDNRVLHRAFLHLLSNVNSVDDARDRSPVGLDTQALERHVVAAGPGGSSAPPWRLVLSSPHGFAPALATPDRMLSAVRSGSEDLAVESGRTFYVVELEMPEGSGRIEVWVVDGALVSQAVNG